MIEKLEIEINKTVNGQGEYVQIRTPAAVPVNIVLIAKQIEVHDAR